MDLSTERVGESYVGNVGVKDSTIVALRYIGAFQAFAHLWALLSFWEYATPSRIAATAVIAVSLVLPLLAGKLLKRSWIAFPVYLILSLGAIGCLGMQAYGDLNMVNSPDHSAAALRTFTAIVIVLLVLQHSPLVRSGGEGVGPS